MVRRIIEGTDADVIAAGVDELMGLPDGYYERRGKRYHDPAGGTLRYRDVTTNDRGESVYELDPIAEQRIESSERDDLKSRIQNIEQNLNKFNDRE